MSKIFLVSTITAILSSILFSGPEKVLALSFTLDSLNALNSGLSNISSSVSSNSASAQSQSAAVSVPQVSYYVPQSYLYQNAALAQSSVPVTPSPAPTPAPQSLFTMPVFSTDFWSRFRTLVVLDYLFKGFSGGILNPSGVDLGSIFILDQLFH